MKSLKLILGSVFIATLSLSSCKSDVKKNGSDKAPLEAQQKASYTSDHGKFSINFPADPTVSHEVVPTAAGDIEMNVCMYEQSKTKVYMVAYADYPDSMIRASNPKDMLKGSKDGALGSFGKAIIDEEKEISMDGYPGLFFRAHSDMDYYVIYRLYMVDNRLYQVGMLQQSNYPAAEDINGFFSSFRLNK